MHAGALFIAVCDVYAAHPSVYVGVFTSLTFKVELFNDCLSFVLVHVYHSHFRPSLAQGMSKRSAYALPGSRHIGHLSIKAHPIEDGAPVDPAENVVIRDFALPQTNGISQNDAFTQRKSSVQSDDSSLAGSPRPDTEVI